MKDLLLSAVVSVFGRRNSVRAARALSAAARFDGVNDLEVNGEALVPAAVARLAARDSAPIVMDVGANIGEWSRGAAQQFRAAGRADGRIYAFEPSSQTFRALQATVAAMGATGQCVIPVQAALSSTVGTASLFVTHPLAGTNSLVRQSELPLDTVESVETTTVSQWCKASGISHVSLLKIDTEGHDLAVLQGATDLLTTRDIDVVQFEYNHRWIYARTFLRDAFELLQPFGYRVGKITPKGIEFYEGWHFELESWREANFIACQPKWAQQFPAVRWWNAST